ncbi:MAG: cobalamin-dependent protein [bacterium]
MPEARKIRILLAKPGLDGHDRGVKVVAQALMEAGFEVIYTGLHQTVEQIVRAALQEDPNIIGLSILSGAHIPLCERIILELRKAKLGGTPVVVGGVIPKSDLKKMNEIGVKAIFTAGAKFDEMADQLRQIAKSNYN